MFVETRRSQLTSRVWPVWVPAESRANRMLRNGSSLRSYNDFAGRNGSGHCGDATMPRDNPEGSSSRWLSSAGGPSPALHVDGRKSSDDKPSCLENPRPAGAESTLTESASSPFHAEPSHFERNREGGGVGGSSGVVCCVCV